MHHPEHYGDRGISGMDLFDVVEMMCDWIASAAGQPGGQVNLSQNVKRSGIDTQLESNLANTLDRWPKADEAGRTVARARP
jgi:hypothetical protein